MRKNPNVKAHFRVIVISYRAWRLVDTTASKKSDRISEFSSVFSRQFSNKL